MASRTLRTPPFRSRAAHATRTARGTYPAALGWLALGLLLVAGCERKAQESSASPAQTSRAEQSQAEPEAPVPKLPAEQVQAVVNPDQRSPYEGPTGSVRGRVVVTGDAPPEQTEILKKVPASCAAAQETFRYLFREGMQRSLADVLVGVTEYSGYVPQKKEAVVVEGRDCAWNTRTVALTYGQRIDVVSKDRNSYVPELVGQKWPVQLFATPGGKPVPLLPRKPGMYVLLDSMRLFNAANVYVVPFSTFDVTGLDGKFEIGGLPPGPAKVSALLPVTGAVVEKTVEVKAGEAVTLELEIHFDRAEYEKRKAEEAAKREESEPATDDSTQP